MSTCFCEPSIGCEIEALYWYHYQGLTGKVVIASKYLVLIKKRNVSFLVLENTTNLGVVFVKEEDWIKPDKRKKIN